MPKIRVSENRIGLIGLYRSGKSVLLTSLVDHLKHDSERFKIKGGTVSLSRFHDFDEAPIGTAVKPPAGWLTPDEGWRRFEHQVVRDRLVHRDLWPHKSRQGLLQYTCRFRRSDWWLNEVQLKIYDYPGERLADAPMYGRAYDEWSDSAVPILRRAIDHKSEPEVYCFKEFVALLDAGGKQATRDALVHAYRLGLARMVSANGPYVTPSTFFQDLDGDVVEVRNPADKARIPPEQIAARRLSGLDVASEFVPLPGSWRTERQDLSLPFEKAYEDYRTKVVDHLVRSLRWCHSLVVLLDVISILESGPEMFNDCKYLTEELMRVIDPGASIWGRAGQAATSCLPHSLRWSNITKIAFVVPKIDLIDPDEWSKLEPLARGIVGRWARDLGGVEVKYFNCSAAVSATPLPTRDERGSRLLSGRTKGGEEKIPSPRLPDRWPMNWSGGTFGRRGDYAFPRFLPNIPKVVSNAPDHLYLGDLFDFLIP